MAFCLFQMTLAFHVGIRTDADDEDFLLSQPSEDHVVLSDLVPEGSSVVVKPVSYSYTTKNTDQRPLESAVHPSSGGQHRRAVVNNGAIKTAPRHETVVHHVAPQRSQQQYQSAATEDHYQPRHEKITHRETEPSRKHVHEEQPRRKQIHDEEEEEEQQGTRNVGSVANREDHMARKQVHNEHDVE